MTPVDNLWINLWITGLFLWITLWTTRGKLRPFRSLWITAQLSTPYPQAKASYPQELSTSPLPCRTGFLPPYPHIHRPYYYGYYLLRSLKKENRSNRKRRNG
jgi:hypothetical protein